VADTLRLVVTLVAEGEIRVSEHGYDRLAEDGIRLRDIIAGVAAAEPVEDYPAFAKGPCVLVLQRDRDGKPVHALWGIPRGESSPAVLITAYRPDPELWDAGLKRRLT
jgi:hypothetical protein